MEHARPAERATARHRVIADIAAAVMLSGAAVLTRLPGFRFSVLDWDESLYFVMAQRWRAGELPYTSMWDNKPIGIYAILAVFQALFGGGIASLRLAGVAATASTACLLYLLARRIIGRTARDGGLCAVLGGLLFVLSSMPDDGLASNSELFMVGFVCLGMLVLVGERAAPRTGGGSAWLAGLAFGAACMVKYVAVFDAAAIALVVAASGVREQRSARWLARWLPAFATGMMVPFLAALALYWRHGEVGTFLQASLLSYLRRAGAAFSLPALLQAFARQVRICPLLWLSAGVLLARIAAAWLHRIALAPGDMRASCLLLIWLLADAVAATSGGFFYSHYFLQLLPPLCIAAALVAARLATLLPGVPVAAMALVILVQPVAEAWQVIAPLLPGAGEAWTQSDTPAAIAADLRPALNGGSVYVFDYQPIIYGLLGVAPPTRYVLPSFLLSPFMARVTGVDSQRELAAIMGRHPAFVVCARVPPRLTGRPADPALYRAMASALAAEYRVWRSYPDAIVYRRESALPNRAGVGTIARQMRPEHG